MKPQICHQYLYAGGGMDLYCFALTVTGIVFTCFSLGGSRPVVLCGPGSGWHHGCVEVCCSVSRGTYTSWLYVCVCLSVWLAVWLFDCASGYVAFPVTVWIAFYSAVCLAV